MEKKMNNKGFSLVELIIVVAIMAVLIGVLAPAYLQYVEKSKKTSDCSAVGSVLDAIEIVAADPGIAWTSGAVTVDFDAAAGSSIYGGPSAVTAQLETIVPSADVELTGTWEAGTGIFDLSATKDTFGNVTFSGLTTDEKDEVTKISPKLANRYE